MFWPKNVLKANSLKARIVGLLGKKSLEKGKTLWILSCSSIHTFFMKFPIDVIFVDKDLKVRRVYKKVPSGKILFGGWKASSVFEFQAGTLKAISKGDQLHVEA